METFADTSAFNAGVKEKNTKTNKLQLLKIKNLQHKTQQIWPPRAILVSDWLMLKKSSPLKLRGQMEPNLA
jgi:hypothetical protein